MADDYRADLKITVYKGTPETMLVSEEVSFSNINFAKMTSISAEYYELLKKLEKTVK